MKPFADALKDSYNHVFETTDPDTLKQLRSDGVQVDAEGYWSYTLRDHPEYEVCIEPMQDEHEYRIVVYKNRVKITEPLQVWMKH